jgi:hypothetical protein
MRGKGMSEKKSRSPEELRQIGHELRQFLDQKVDGYYASIEAPEALGHMFSGLRSTGDGINCGTLNSAMEHFAGLFLASQLPAYLELHSRLHEAGHDASNMFEFANDTFVYAVRDAVVESPDKGLEAALEDLLGSDKNGCDVTVKAFALQTQSLNFIIVMNQLFGQWSIDIRRFWPSLQSELSNPNSYLGELEAFRVSRDAVSAADLVRHAERAAKYADDVEGVTFSSRPSLAMFLAGNMVAGNEKAGVGLRYADGRDKGFVASLQRSTDHAIAKDAGRWVTLSELEYVSCNLSAAIDTLQREQSGRDERQIG